MIIQNAHVAEGGRIQTLLIECKAHMFHFVSEHGSFTNLFLLLWFRRHTLQFSFVYSLFSVCWKYHTHQPNVAANPFSNLYYYLWISFGHSMHVLVSGNGTAAHQLMTTRVQTNAASPVALNNTVEGTSGSLQRGVTSNLNACRRVGRACGAEEAHTGRRKEAHG